MKNQTPENQPSGISLTDIYYVLFRHKWKIICFSAAGLLAGALIFIFKPVIYSSEAKLFIRYVLEAKVPSGMAGGDQQVRTPDPGGANIINSEIEIIKSLDLAVQVVEAIGVEKILGKSNGDTNKYLAAAIIKGGLIVDVPSRSDIITIVFQHPNREIVQPVLTQLVASYSKKHVEVHRPVGLYDDFLTQQTDGARSLLAQAEEDLRKSKIKAGVMSMEDARKAYTEQISRIRQSLFDTEAELAERQAALKEREKLQSGKAEIPAPAEVVPLEKINEYRTVSARLDSFRKKEQELLTQFTEENETVKGIRQVIAVAEKLQKQLQEEYPKLSGLSVPSTPAGTPMADLSVDRARITALQAKLQTLNSQMEKVVAEAKTVNEMEPAITDLTRRKELEETQYRHFSTSLEQARFDEALGAGRMSNISIAQAPTPPVREVPKLVKSVGMVILGGILAGIGLAFLIEFFLDRTIKRPVEIGTLLRLPLFLTIPDSARNGRFKHTGLQSNGHARLPGPEPDSENSAAPWDESHGLKVFYEALRDRLVAHFDIGNLTHKPKLIALTGCAKSVGVTTIARGLAASLSQIGDGNVLLVDMNLGQGTAHPFYKGKPACGLADALETQTRDTAFVQENLYVVTEGNSGDKLASVLPKRFSHLIPKLKASDYDYIIFDMPPVSQISVTPRLAGFMDMVLLVIESEKTDRDAAQQAREMLSESKASVATVLNKARSYVPRWLHHGYLGEV